MSTAVPSYCDLLWPTLQAVMAMDGSGRIDEVNRAAIDREGYSDEQQAVLHGDGPITEIEYRLGWGSNLPEGHGAAREQCARRLVDQ